MFAWFWFGKDVGVTARARLLLGAVTITVLLGVSACGDGGDPAASGSPTPTTSTAPATSASPTKKPKPPLSPFEDRAPVKALRRWAVLVPKAVDRGQRDLALARSTMTPHGLRLARSAETDDLAHHYYLPGPQPFTPVRVEVSGDRADVSTCYLNYGWSEDRRTHRPVHHRQVVSAVMVMKRVGRSWRWDGPQTGVADCKHVKIPEVKW